MCGIAGIYAPAVKRDILREMAAKLEHRGPDDFGVYIDDHVGLAHTRLSIIDPETGHQPLFNEDGTVAVIFNGEIYNYRRLRQSLSKSGHSFETETDTEVLVHLYEEEGTDFVNRLNGMFAFALWDTKRECLILARDPIGIKPLLVAIDDEKVAFASELPSLLEANIDHGGIDTKSLAEYFGLGHIPAPRTIFSNIRKLHPGERIVISEKGISQTDFYTPSIEPNHTSYAEAVTTLRNHVEDAVEKRLMSDVPLGAFLSGGIDSSIIVGMMAALMDTPVRTFTVGFEESLFDESWAARDVAEYHDTNHVEYTVTPEDVRSTIPQILDRLGEPFADQSLIPTSIVARETSRDVKVALSGDGADELFAGYDRYRAEYYSQYYRHVPTTVQNRVIGPAVTGLPVSRENRRGEVIHKAQEFIGGGGISKTADRHFEWACIVDDAARAAFKSFNPGDNGRNRFRQAHRSAESYLPAERQDDMSRVLAVDTRFGLPNQILHKTDRASMYNSLEVRVPFLDTRIVEYAMSLPANYKITRRKQKRILKQAFDDVLPDSILERRKRGFDMPIGEWFKNELEAEFTDAVTAADTDFIDTKTVFDVFKDHKTGRGQHSKFLWAVYVFARWHRRMEENGVI